jgi:hypothetical protein
MNNSNDIFSHGRETQNDYDCCCCLDCYRSESQCLVIVIDRWNVFHSILVDLHMYNLNFNKISL